MDCKQNVNFEKLHVVNVSMFCVVTDDKEAKSIDRPKLVHYLAYNFNHADQITSEFLSINI